MNCVSFLQTVQRVRAWGGGGKEGYRGDDIIRNINIFIQSVKEGVARKKRVVVSSRHTYDV